MFKILVTGTVDALTTQKGCWLQHWCRQLEPSWTSVPSYLLDCGELRRMLRYLTRKEPGHSRSSYLRFVMEAFQYFDKQGIYSCVCAWSSGNFRVHNLHCSVVGCSLPSWSFAVYNLCSGTWWACSQFNMGKVAPRLFLLSSHCDWNSVLIIPVNHTTFSSSVWYV